MKKDEYQELLAKYKNKIKEEFGEQAIKTPKITSQEYSQFKKELYPTHYSLYEKLCNSSESILKLQEDPKKAIKVQKDLDLCMLAHFF